MPAPGLKPGLPALAASMPLAPLRNDCVRPPGGALAAAPTFFVQRIATWCAQAFVGWVERSETHAVEVEEIPKCPESTVLERLH
ncbi:hypothetical protein PSm6_48020 [Pseudomonas solani]|uniref:Uncharacterized protein n=1 Tax=Pseudomonas solani TaxID=2731552 RepID=A0ABN6BZ25_9PSED|nr:hypothetical protein PSm6_48020 [Pseudomonas solani]